MAAYYNEKDPYAAQWLRNLISADHIAPGEVDERSIVDVRPSDLGGFGQCHFFAGIGIWSAALRQAGWPDSRHVWTGSCPCQPFSAAGKRQGEADDRHLWPELYRLIALRRPLVVFGEQVASKDGLAWLDLVQTDLEASGYASGAIDLCAAGVGAPHIRQRLFWMAHANGGDASAEGLQRGRQHGQQPQDSGALLLGNARGAGLPQRECDGRVQREALGPQPGQAAERRSDTGALDHSADARHDDAGQHGRRSPLLASRPIEPGPVGGFWADAEWIPCTDGKARPVESGTFPLAHVDPNRVGRLRAYGNAINQEVAAAFIEAASEILSGD